MKELQDYEWKKLIQPELPGGITEEIVGKAARESRDKIPVVLKIVLGVILLMGIVFTLWSLRENGSGELFTPAVILSLLFTAGVLGALYRLRKN